LYLPISLLIFSIASDEVKTLCRETAATATAASDKNEKYLILPMKGSHPCIIRLWMEIKIEWFFTELLLRRKANT
jgi:hypothetical protein